MCVCVVCVRVCVCVTIKESATCRVVHWCVCVCDDQGVRYLQGGTLVLFFLGAGETTWRPVSLPPVPGHPSGTRAVYGLLCSEGMVVRERRWDLLVSQLLHGGDFQTGRGTPFLFALQTVLIDACWHHHGNSSSVSGNPCPHMNHATLQDMCSNRKIYYCKSFMSLIDPVP